MEAYLYKRILASFLFLLSGLLIVGAETGEISKPSNGGIVTSILFMIASYCAFFMKHYKCLVCLFAAGELLAVYFIANSIATGNINAIALVAAAGLVGVISLFFVFLYRDGFVMQNRKQIFRNYPF